MRQGTGHRARRVRRSPDRLPLRRRAWQPSPLQAWRWPGLRVPAPLPRLGVAPRCRPAGHAAPCPTPMAPPLRRHRVAPPPAVGAGAPAAPPALPPRRAPRAACHRESPGRPGLPGGPGPAARRRPARAGADGVRAPGAACLARAGPPLPGAHHRARRALARWRPAALGGQSPQGAPGPASHAGRPRRAPPWPGAAHAAGRAARARARLLPWGLSPTAGPRAAGAPALAPPRWPPRAPGRPDAAG